MGTISGTEGEPHVKTNKLAPADEAEAVHEKGIEQNEETAIAVKPDKKAERTEKAKFGNYWVRRCCLLRDRWLTTRLANRESAPTAPVPMESCSWWASCARRAQARLCHS